MRQLILIIAICTGVLWGGPAGADDADDVVWDKAVAAYIRGDYAEAMNWCRKAAEQGQAGAQYNLGDMYHQGQGVPQDFVWAHMWLNLASVHEDKVSGKQRDKVAKLMTPAEIRKAQRLAREWRPKK